MTVNHRQRRRHYWIALWAVLALLLNQTVAASHFCPNAALAAPHASSALTQPGHSHAGAASASVGSADPMPCSPTHDRSACTVHCSHAADGDQRVKAPTVLMLPASGFFFQAALPDTVMATRSRTVGVVLDSRQRRLYEFCTLLI